MRFFRCVRFAGLLTGVVLLLGCNNKPTGMPGMVPGNGPGQQRDLPLKAGKKPLPYEPPSPKPPP
jgi:hypothetical protein